MLKDDVGYNISPTEWDKKFKEIGNPYSGTFVTDRKAIESVLGPLDKFDPSKVTKQQVKQLEQMLGLKEDSLSSGFKIREVTGLSQRGAKLPEQGNDKFQAGERPPEGPQRLRFLIAFQLLTAME